MERPILFSSLTKAYGSVEVVKDFNASILPGQFVSLLGHSGCGKSTVLSILAGLQEATSGGIIIDGREIDGPALSRAIVFQSPSLLPWLTALENVRLAYSQANPKTSARSQRDAAQHYLDMVGIGNYAHSLPSELSQGTQQRVSIARAFSLEPRILLLDEPFGMLHSITRLELQDLLLDLWEQQRKTVVLVTHDIDEAIYLSDRILLMTDGPESKLGLDITVPLPRPRDRRMATDDPAYFQLCREVIGFLVSHTRQFAAV